MDITKRQLTKIAREASKLAVKVMREEGVGAAEFDFIHEVRHHPGITQAEVCCALGMDKGAAARRAMSLIRKGYLIRKANPADGRSWLLYASEKAEFLRNSKASIEATFYAWLLEALCEEERAAFARTLETLYARSKAQSRAGFPDVLARIARGEVETDA